MTLVQRKHPHLPGVDAAAGEHGSVGAALRQLKSTLAGLTARSDMSNADKLTLEQIEAALASAFEDTFLTYWGNSGWRALIDAVREVDAPRVVAILAAASAIEFDANYMRKKIDAAGLRRSAAVADYLDVWLVEETDHGRAFDELVVRLSKGRVASEKPKHNTFARDPRAIVAIPAMWATRRYLRGTIAGYMVRGVLVESTAIKIYGAVARELSRAGADEASQIVQRIAAQEGRHLRYFKHGAKLLLQGNPTLAKVIRVTTERTWRPPGVDLFGRRRWTELFAPILSDPAAVADLASIDATIGALPGFAGSTIVATYLEGLRCEFGGGVA